MWNSATGLEAPIRIDAAVAVPVLSIPPVHPLHISQPSTHIIIGRDVEERWN